MLSAEEIAMHLRKLRREDAPAMLAWMHDPSVVAQMGTNFAAKTMDDCLAFIADSEKNAAFVHFAVADDNDHYMGTVSLKHIDFRRQCGEFAITVCAQAMGKGYAHFAMEEILFDPQTSGGLLAAVDAGEAEDILKELQAIGLPARIVGQVTKKAQKEIVIL